MNARSTLLTLASLFAATSAFAHPQDRGELDLEELEARFEERMSGVSLVGSFTLDGAPKGEAPREDTYVLREISKLAGSEWEIVAEIGYADPPIEVELVIDVEWAGDTPVFTVTDLAVPTLGTYSARVAFYGDRYAGLWQGDGYGGHMYGYVVPLEEEVEAEAEVDPEGGRRLGAPVPASVDELRAADLAGNWPSFHGAGGGGLQEGWSTPVTWDVETGENVLWSRPVAGLSHSSPVVWGDRVYVTTAVGEGDAELKVGLYGNIFPVKDEGSHRMQLLCIDRNDGRVLWTRTAYEGVPAVLRHPKGSHAASSPATDGERVVAFFGSEGLYCYSTDGELLWNKNFGVLDSGYFLAAKVQWGFASSPVLHDGKVLVQCDVNGESFVAALDATNGRELWRTARDEVPTWGTPTVDVRPGRAQVICNGYKHIGGYDLATGAELWKLEGGGDIPVPTPVVAHDLIYITNAHGKLAPIFAIAAGASGTLTMEAKDDPRMAWSKTKRGNYMQTPVVAGARLYCCSDAGILGCYDARTGEEVFRERLGAGGQGFTSSAVAADGKLYCTSEEGEVHVIRIGDDVDALDVLATNDLGETCMSTAAVSRGVLFFRTRTQLIAIGEK
ncbi:MAG: PQQ-binding-like beta-propeller repeat protein [Planctomycetota bacterium]